MFTMDDLVVTIDLLLFIAKTATLITDVLALVILGYLQLGQDNKSRKSF